MSGRAKQQLRHKCLAAAIALALPPCITLVAAAVYREKHRPKLPDRYTLRDLRGQTVVATGASSGIGRATVAKLRDDLGATVVSGSRTEGNLDLSDLASVKRFAASVDRCDVLLACAGEIEHDSSSSSSSTTSVDGFDRGFATNHVGLQALLMEMEEKKTLQLPSRVVVLASKLERNGLVDPEVVQRERGQKLNDDHDHEPYSPVRHYSDTKRCNQLLTTALAERWGGGGTTKVYSVSPGMVDTGLWRHFPAWFRFLTWPVRKVGLRTPEDAALGVVYACASEEAGQEESGAFFVDGRVELPSEDSLDKEKARKLWKVVEDLIREQSPRD